MSQFLRDQASDSEEVVTPLMLDGTYLSRNFATLGPLTSQPPCVGRLTGRCRIQLDRLESGVLQAVPVREGTIGVTKERMNDQAGRTSKSSNLLPAYRRSRSFSFTPFIPSLPTLILFPFTTTIGKRMRLEGMNTRH